MHVMTNTKWTLFAMSIACALLAGCSMTPETTGAVLGGGAILIELAKHITPHLSAEDSAKVVEYAQSAQNWMDFLGNTMGRIAESAAAAKQRAEASPGLTAGETTSIAGGIGAIALAGSRYLSARKDEKTGRRAAQSAS